MQTTFILHGGFDFKKPNEDSSDFYQEILKDAPQQTHVLIVPFSKDTDRIPRAVEKITEQFNKAKGEKHLNFKVATEKDFLDEISGADVLYFPGGISLKLLEVLKKYPKLADHLKGKIVAGESAGANVWGTFFYSPHANGVFQGLGVLPIKVIPHYTPEREGLLDAVGTDLELVLLPEYAFRVFKI